MSWQFVKKVHACHFTVWLWRLRRYYLVYEKLPDKYWSIQLGKSSVRRLGSKPCIDRSLVIAQRCVSKCYLDVFFNIKYGMGVKM